MLVVRPRVVDRGRNEGERRRGTGAGQFQWEEVSIVVDCLHFYRWVQSGLVSLSGY